VFFIFCFGYFSQGDEVMKRLGLLIACILLGSTLVAQAELIQVRQVRTAGATYDEIDLYVTSITGTDVDAGDYLTGLKGTYTLPTGGSFFLSSASNWYTKNVNDADFQDTAGPTAGTSWIDFSTQVAADPHTRTGGSGNLWNSFTQSMSATGANLGAFFLGPVDLTPGGTDPSVGDGTGFDNTLFAKIWVNHACPDLNGATIFSGVGNFAWPQGGHAMPGISATVKVVPEPTTLALLGCGLFGLLAYAWRKRK
jgi:hypothetical protein